MKLTLLFLIAAATSSHQLHAQVEEIYLKNPSFEGVPGPGNPPEGWFDCRFEGESPVDIQPDHTFNVSKPPYEGYSYLGMVVRDNSTWEAVSQRLSVLLEKGKCYEFSIYLARSEKYESPSASGRDSGNQDVVNYTTPVTLKIFGGNGICGRADLLDKSKEVVNHRWIQYNFRFEPTDNYSHIVLEAFYKTPVIFPYNGNLLLDNASPIRVVPCDEEPPVAVVEPDPEPLVPTPVPAPPVPTPPTPTPDPEPTPDPVVSTPDPVDEPTLGGITRNELKEGQTVRIENLFFQADSAVVVSTSHETLDEIYTFLKANEDVIVEIGGHTNSLPSSNYAMKLSTDRAKAVYEYLIRKGIGRQRLTYKGYGKSAPIESNSTLAGRKRNQRVEIKVIGFTG